MKKKSWGLREKDVIGGLGQLQKLVLREREWGEGELRGEWGEKWLGARELGLEEKELSRATARLADAIKKKQRVVIFGDYDVDGNCATAVLWLCLKAAGLIAVPFIPHRLKHGYGLAVGALQEIFAAGKPDLVVTVDNGITARAALEFCKREGVAVIVTDHHQRAEKLPAVAAIVQTPKLAGTGVAWVVGRAVLQRVEPELAEQVSRELLDLVALGTVVDQVPQKGINRRLVRAGLAQLRQTKRPGILALAEVAGLNLPQLSGRDLGFGLGPRLNAVGRLTHTLEALRLLCTKQQKLAASLARSLQTVNAERQELTKEMLELALGQVEEKDLTPIVIVASEQFHEGIIGLLASKLGDKYHRPAVVISVGAATAKGSCRSVGDFNITSFMQEFKNELVDLGGHALAAGFTLKPERVATLMEKVRRKSAQELSERCWQEEVTGLARVSLGILADEGLVSFLDQLEPFGAGNPELVVEVKGKVGEKKRLGREEQHLKLRLMDDEGRAEVLLWGWAQKGKGEPRVGEEIRVLGELKNDWWRGRGRVTVVARDWERA